MEGVGGVGGVGGIGEAVGGSVCRVLVGGLDLLDHDLLALQQIGLAATAMGAGLAVLDRRVVAAARLAMRHGLDRLHNKLRALRDRLFICRPAPSVKQQIGNDARDLAQEQCHARNATHTIGARHILDIENDVIDNPELVHFLTDNALDSVHWLESLGVEFKDEIGSATGSLGQRSHYPATPSGNTYIRSFQQFIDDNADAIMLLNDMQAKELILDDAGAVVGVKALYDGEQEVTVNCGAVVIATGGFGGNVEYRQKVNTGVWKEVVLDDSIGCTNIKPCAQGEGMVLAENAGAELICLSDIQLHPCGTPGTGLMEDIRTSGRNRIFVNTDGKRFVNEGAERDVLCKNIFAQPDGTYWVVVNTLRYPDPDEPDANGATINNMLALGHIVTGDTVEALAGEMGVDAANLQASIDAYNAVVEGGTDEFGFVADNTADAAMTEGPWYACRKVPTVHHTMGGIRVNVESEACNADGEPIPGLYAAGECTGGIHGENRLGGNAIADCMTFGRNAGTNAAKYALA